MQKPIYLQIKDNINDAIKLLAPHTMIESERELAKKFSVSRMTVRKSIDMLVEDGYLYRNKNLGTFVTDRSVVKKDAVSTILDQEYEHKILYFNIRLPEKELASILKIDTNDWIVRIAKSNLQGDRVVSVDDIYYVKKYVPYTDIKSISKLIDITKLLKEGLLNQRFIPLNVPVNYANILKLKLNTPIILIESLISTKDGIPLAFIRSYNNPKEKVIEIVT